MIFSSKKPVKRSDDEGGSESFSISPPPAKLAMYWWLPRACLIVFIYLPIALWVLQHEGQINLSVAAAEALTSQGIFYDVSFSVLVVLALAALYGWYYLLARKCVYTFTKGSYRCTLGLVYIAYRDIREIRVHRSFWSKRAGCMGVRLRPKSDKKESFYWTFSTVWSIPTIRHIDGLTSEQAEKIVALVRQHLT